MPRLFLFVLPLRSKHWQLNILLGFFKINYGLVDNTTSQNLHPGRPTINPLNTFMSTHKHSIHQLKTSWKIRDHHLISQSTHSKVVARSIWRWPILWSHPPPMWSQMYLAFYVNHVASMSHCRLNLQNEHTDMLLSIRVWYSLMAWWNSARNSSGFQLSYTHFA